MSKSNRARTLLSCAATLGCVLGWGGVAYAHGDYLNEVDDETGGNAACGLGPNGCGLCHASAGNRNENVYIGNGDIMRMLRNGPFYDSLTSAALGWPHEPHSAGAGHQGRNADLLETALNSMRAAMTDSDGDGVPDLEEIEAGYNPLLAYDPGDEAASQLCNNAMAWPGMMMMGDGGMDGGSDAGTDASVPDAMVTPDASTTPDATVMPDGSTGTPDASTGEVGDDDDGCSVGGADAFGTGGLFAFLVGTLWIRRRRG
ncbi:MAG: hypothetical protein AAGF12_22270 [Myxococcota bacterium]